MCGKPVSTHAHATPTHAFHALPASVMPSAQSPPQHSAHRAPVVEERLGAQGISASTPLLDEQEGARNWRRVRHGVIARQETTAA
eukprot:6186878-Pleurochrysis_carterae.AAC.1